MKRLISILFACTVLAHSLTAQIMLSINNATDTISISGVGGQLAIGQFGGTSWGSSSGTVARGSFNFNGTLANGSSTSGSGWVYVYYDGSGFNGAAFQFGASVPSNTYFSNLSISGSSFLSNWGDYEGSDFWATQSPQISGVSNRSLSITSIPEPSTYAAILGGLALLYFVVQRKRAQTA
jgi:hypothetical protein